MDGSFVRYRVLVELGVLPDAVVLAADRGERIVIHGALRMPTLAPDVVLLDTLGRVLEVTSCPLLAVEVYEGAETYHEGRDDEADYEPGLIDAAACRRTLHAAP